MLFRLAVNKWLLFSWADEREPGAVLYYHKCIPHTPVRPTALQTRLLANSQMIAYYRNNRRGAILWRKLVISPILSPRHIAANTAFIALRRGYCSSARLRTHFYSRYIMLTANYLGWVSSRTLWERSGRP